VTKDLSIASPMLRVTGRGSTNLANQGIDLNLLASLMESPGASIVDVPLKLTGTFANPTVRPDLDAFAKGQLKQKLEDLLEKNGLKGLFGK
jgi:AsmA protein